MQGDPRIKSYDAQLDEQTLQQQTNPDNKGTATAASQHKIALRNHNIPHSGGSSNKNKQHATFGLSDDAVYE